MSTMTALEPRPAEGCRRCAELASNRRCIVHGYGPVPARVMIVGEAPGYRGAGVTGVPFTRDRSGRRLQQLLIDVGLSDETEPGAERPRLRCFVTNVVRCNPPGNRRPSPAEIATCLPNLWQEMAAVRPEIVVPVGNIALQAVARRLLGRAAPPIGQAHAQMWPTGLDGPRLIVPMRHPARISNSDLRRAAAALGEILSEQ